MNTQVTTDLPREQAIRAREKAAPPLTAWEIEAWRRSLDTLMHDANLGTTLRWKQERRALATIDALLAELEKTRAKLEAVERWRDGLGKRAGWGAVGKVAALDRILKGAE